MHADGDGIYVRTGGYLFRPKAVTGVRFSKHHAGDRVAARHVPGTQQARVGSGVMRETWVSAGGPYLRPQADTAAEAASPGCQPQA